MEQKLDNKARAYCFTWNNYNVDNWEYVKNVDCRYIVVSQEVGENGTPHLQGYIYFKSPISWRSMTKKFKGCHISVARKAACVNRDYITKRKKFDPDPKIIYEDGDMPEQGARGDLIDLRDQINSGLSVKEIRQDHPHLYHQYGRTLDKLEDDNMLSIERDFMTEGIWYFGPTQVGKSRRAFQSADRQNRFTWISDGRWWDGYAGQETVILDDFRGGVPYNELLKLVDRYDYKVPRRGRQPMPFLAKRVIVTSVLAPEEVYKNLAENDTLDQLYRRFRVVQLFPDGQELEQKCPSNNNWALFQNMGNIDDVD